MAMKMLVLKSKFNFEYIFFSKIIDEWIDIISVLASVMKTFYRFSIIFNLEDHAYIFDQ